MTLSSEVLLNKDIGISLQCLGKPMNAQKKKKKPLIGLKMGKAAAMKIFKTFGENSKTGALSPELL